MVDEFLLQEAIALVRRSRAREKRGWETPEGEKEGNREGWWNESTKEWSKLEQLESLAVEKAGVVNRREQRTCGGESSARRAERCEEMQMALFALGGSEGGTGPSCWLR